MSADISGIIKSTGVALEHEALKQFGAAVADTTSGALRNVFGTTQGSPTGTGQNPVTQETGVYDTTRYAAALVKADQAEFNPKLKFLFKVSFKFSPKMLQAASAMGYDMSRIEQNSSFMIRHVDRPKFDYDYEEVNLYNFRTKVLKSIRHREVGFTLYDDVGNNVLSFVNLYRKLQSPIARMQQTPTAAHDDFGFEFDTSLARTDTSMRGALPGDAINILDSMTIHQIFVERGAQNNVASSWVKTVDFVFMNPRFTNIDIDDMDHENGANFNLVTVTSDFDTMFMSEPKPFTQAMAPSLPSGDISADGARGAGNAAGGTRNPFIDIIVNQTSRGVTQGLSNIINKTLSTSPGGAILAGAITPVTSMLGEHTRRTLSSMAAGVTNGFSTSAKPLVVDDSVVSSQVQNLSSRTYSDDDINGLI